MNDVRSFAADAYGILDALAGPNARFARRYPGDPPERQPAHTVYGGAQLFRHDLSPRLGAKALASLDEYAPDPFTFARAIGMEGAGALPEKAKAREALIARARKKPDAVREEDPAAWLAVAVYDRVRAKLEKEPVEDFRIDFEDGFGVRPEAEEDAAAIAAAREVAIGMASGTLPPFLGIRIKPLNEEMKARSARTLELFFTTLVEETKGALPPWIAVTLPKVPVPEQAAALARLLDKLEHHLGVPERSIKMELMIELTQSIFDAEGRFNLPRLLDACEGRCAGAHFGTYDYTASCGITAAWQTMAHPACQLALGLMKIAYASTGIFLSDGATNVLPVPLHRADGKKGLKKSQLDANRRAVHGAWALSYRHIQSSLANGFYQGWDLHPAQLPVRYAATFEFFLRGFDAAAARLSNFVDKAAQATLVGEVFDDAATGQGLLNYFLRAWSAGAVSLDELGATGLSMDEIRTRSFARILEGRTRRAGDAAREREAIEVSALIEGVSPDAIYAAWIDGALHAEMTGGAAESEPHPGARFTAWDGYIEGTHIALERPHRIVQAWRTTEFPDDAPDSRLEVRLDAVDGGTRVTIVHGDIPAGQGAKYESGWQAHYIEPMRAYFAR